MSVRDKLKPTGHKGLFYTDHLSRKYGIKYDRQWVIRQTLGGVTRVSVLGWTSENILIGTALNKIAEYRANYKWNLLNPDQPPKPLCIADEKKIAQKIAAAEEARQLEKHRPTFKFLWADYSQTLRKSLAADKSRFNTHLKDIHDKTPEEILPQDIKNIQDKLTKAKLSPQTIKHCLTLITRIAYYGADELKCKPLQFRIKKPSFSNEVTEYLSDDQLESLLKTIKADLVRDPFTGRAMLLALTTGMRRGALLQLKWVDIDYTSEFIFLRHAKSIIENKTNKIPLNEAAKQILIDIPKTESPYVFPGKKGKDGEWKQRSDFNRGSKRIRNAAELPDDFRPFHGLRHHYASSLANSGEVDLYTLQKLMTHKDPATTQRYAHLSDNRLKQGAAVANSLIEKRK